MYCWLLEMNCLLKDLKCKRSVYNVTRAAASITLKKQVKGKIYIVIAVITMKNNDESIQFYLKF